MISIITLTCVLFAGAPGSPDSFGNEVSLEKTLEMIPEGALALGVVPRLDRLNDDMAEMLDAMNRPSTVLAGRPIEMLKAQMGISAGLNERGSLAAWIQSPQADDSDEPSSAFLIPASDPNAFLEGNFNRSDDAWLRPGGCAARVRR